MVEREQREASISTFIKDFIAQGQAEGASVVTGGVTKSVGQGQSIQPILFSGMTPDMALARDEIFGPVLCSMPFDTIGQAIALAIDTVYGLAPSVWCKPIDTSLTVTHRVRVGWFWVNCRMAGGPEMPLGEF